MSAKNHVEEIPNPALRKEEIPNAEAEEIPNSMLPRIEFLPRKAFRTGFHSVFVLSTEGKPLMPTTPCKANKLLKAGVAKKVWSKFNTFGIQLLVSTRTHTQACSMGIDQGTKFEGYSVVCDQENSLNIKLDLPEKKKVKSKLEERRTLRRNRRFRNCRRRKARFDNRGRKNFLAPSQRVIVQSRLKVIRELARLYPVTKAGLENVCFPHVKHKWGANFSTVEIGKALIRRVFADLQITLHEYQGWETSETRKRYGYNKGSDKSADRFEAHCSDSLSLACLVQHDTPVVPGRLIVVDDTYRCVRRRLHDTQFSPGGIRADYSKGTVLGLRKGLRVGHKGQSHILTGINKGKYRLNDKSRSSITKLEFVSNQFITR